MRTRIMERIHTCRDFGKPCGGRDIAASLAYTSKEFVPSSFTASSTFSSVVFYLLLKTNLGVF